MKFRNSAAALYGLGELLYNHGILNKNDDTVHLPNISFVITDPKVSFETEQYPLMKALPEDYRNPEIKFPKKFSKLANLINGEREDYHVYNIDNEYYFTKRGSILSLTYCHHDGDLPLILGVRYTFIKMYNLLKHMCERTQLTMGDINYYLPEGISLDKSSIYEIAAFMDDFEANKITIINNEKAYI